MTTDETLRDAIESVVMGAAPDAKVLKNWLYGLGRGESVPYLKSSLGVHSAVPVVHAYMISLEERVREHISGNIKFHDSLVYKLWGFYQFSYTNDNVNSEKVFAAEIESVINALSRKPKLGLNDSSIQHHDWRVSDIYVTNFGQDKLHVAEGELSVELTVQLS